MRLSSHLSRARALLSRKDVDVRETLYTLQSLSGVISIRNERQKKKTLPCSQED